jgi:hypothetical protein
MLTFTPLNFVPWDAAGAALADAEAAGADAAGAAETGTAEGVLALHADRIRIKLTAGAIDLNRDTGFLLLTALRPSSILNDRR